MKKLILALTLALSVGNTSLLAPASAQSTVGPGQQILCPQQAMATPAAAGTLSLVAGNAAQIIVVCGWHVTSTQSASTTFQLEYGTQGGPCTTPTTLTPAFSVTSTAPSGDHIEYASFTIPKGAQLCVVTTGATVAMAVLVYYSQF